MNLQLGLKTILTLHFKTGFMSALNPFPRRLFTEALVLVKGFQNVRF